ncbi:MAG: hypothetical protein ACK55Z_17510, partial [bacterium]
QETVHAAWPLAGPRGARGSGLVHLEFPALHLVDRAREDVLRVSALEGQFELDQCLGCPRLAHECLRGIGEVLLAIDVSLDHHRAEVGVAPTGADEHGNGHGERSALVGGLRLHVRRASAESIDVD